MPAPTASTLHFACNFSLTAKADVLADWGNIVRLVSAWVRRNPLIGNEINQRWFFEGGEWRSGRTPRLSVQTSLLDDDEFAWACRYEHPCREHQFRQWRTDIAVERSSPSEYHFSLDVHHWLLPNYIGEEPEKPLPTAPTIIRMLFDSKHWQPKAGSEILDTQPIEVGIGDGKQAVARLADPARKCPVIWVTYNPERVGPSLDVNELARLVSGAAVVYTTLGRDVDEELGWLLPPGLVARSGSVRIYQPGLRTDSVQDFKRHRFLNRAQIDQHGEKAIQEMIVRGVARRSRFGTPTWITSIEDVARRKREIRLAALHVHANDNPVEWIKLLQEDNSSLVTQINDLKAEKYAIEFMSLEKDDDLEDLQLDIDNKVGQIAYLRQENGELRERLEVSERRLAVVAEFKSLPTTLSEVVDAIQKLFPGSIYFTPEAERSVEESTFEDVGTAWSLLWGAATTLHTLLFEGNRSTSDIEQEFRAATGFALSFTEGKSTKADRKLMRLRRVDYSGRELEIVPHIKFGTRPPRCLRVHFAPDHTDKIIVVGYCGDHMDTSGTKRM
jgi:hypothetical protein